MFSKSMKVMIAILAFTTSFFSTTANANQIFQFSFSGAGISGSGSLIASPNANGTFTALSGSGTETVDGNFTTLTLIGNPNGSVQTLSTSGRFIYDDVLFTTSPFIDSAGLLFLTGSGNELNLLGGLSNDPLRNYLFVASDRPPGSAGLRYVTFALAQTGTVPEPSSILIMVIGLFGLLAVRRRMSE